MRLDLLDNKAGLVLVVKPDLRDHLDNRENKDLVDLKEHLDHVEIQGYQAEMVS